MQKKRNCSQVFEAFVLKYYKMFTQQAKQTFVRGKQIME